MIGGSLSTPTSSASKTASDSDYAKELARIDGEIADAGPEPFALPFDYERAITYVHRRFARSSLTGRFRDAQAAELSIGEAMPLLEDPSDLHYLQAQIDLRYHRLAAVRARLAAATTLRESSMGTMIAADVDFQAGEYARAEQTYQRVIERDRSWDALARLAHLRAKQGQVEAAEALYLEAEDELTAKQMRSFAWLEVQRGELAVARGDLARAWELYERADRAYSGSWMVAEHKAEILAARHQFEQAVPLYEQAIAATEKPELTHVLADLYQVMGDAERSETCYRAALEGYLESVRRGDVHYYHHLVDLYVDGFRDTASAVRFAREDLALRESAATQSALAWALFEHGELEEAVQWMERALASGFVNDAHGFSGAARILAAAGKQDAAEVLQARARILNPHPTRFHVHR